MKRQIIIQLAVEKSRDLREPFADGEGDDGGVVSGEEVLAPWFQFPHFLLREVFVSGVSQPLLGLI